VALLTLFRFTTGENWNGFMHNLALKQKGCVETPPFDAHMCGFAGVDDPPGCVPLNGCGKVAAYPFLYSFTIFVTVVALNLFVGVILSGFAQAGESGRLLAPEDFAIFQEIWMEYVSFSCRDSIQTPWTAPWFSIHGAIVSIQTSLERSVGTCTCTFGCSRKYHRHLPSLPLTSSIETHHGKS